MHYGLKILAGAALSVIVANGAPIWAQDGVAGPSSERIKQVIVYGNDPCPQGDGSEIVVCARQDEKERYRIPKELRDTPDFGSTTNETWSSRVKSIEYVGASGTESCTPDGLGGVTGCFKKLAAQAKAERRMTGEKSWADKVAEQREKRLSTIDSDSDEIEARVKAEEAAKAAEAAAEAAEDTASGIEPK